MMNCGQSRGRGGGGGSNMLIWVVSIVSKEQQEQNQRRLAAERLTLPVLRAYSIQSNDLYSPLVMAIFGLSSRGFLPGTGVTSRGERVISLINAAVLAQAPFFVGFVFL